MGTVKKEGYRSLGRKGSFIGTIEQDLPLWRGEVDDAIRQRRVAAAVWDSSFTEWRISYSLQIDQHLEATQRLFSGSGYAVTLVRPPYTVWLRQGAPPAGGLPVQVPLTQE